jgi:hypothetical protein
VEEPNLNKILYKDHPAIGTKRAAYQFLIEGSNGTPVRFLLVEAENPWAVAAIEKILLRDARISNNCRIIAVFRDHRFAGVRDELLEEISFVDFIVEMVDSERLQDPIVSFCMKKALSKEEKEHARERIEEMKSYIPKAEAAPVRTESVKDEAFGVREIELISSALCGLGFKKNEVKGFTASLGSRVKSEPIPELIKEGLKVLSA